MSALGKKGETLACLWLRLHGYQILKRNYHSRFGEIDIIAKKCGVTSFVEVKARGENTLSTPASAVDIYKQQKLIKTANQYLTFCDNPDGEFRFDVVEIQKHGTHYKIKLIKNAFEI